MGKNFYPQACVGLARIAIERGEEKQARRHLLAALDLTRPLGPEAEGPLGVLDAVCRGLMALEEPLEVGLTWSATLDLPEETGPRPQLTLLVCAADRARARD